MKKSKILSAVMASVLSVALLTGCGSASAGGSKESSTGEAKEGKYIIACDAKYAPFSFEENGSYKGIDVELLDAIAKEEGFEYELKPMDFQAVIPWSNCRYKYYR